jgi:biopolymer transport protein ExbD
MDAKQHQWFLNALKRKNYLYRRIDVWGFVSVMLALLFLLMPNTTDYHNSTRNSVDLAETHHAIPMPGAAREDAMRIIITRDGKVYFRKHGVVPADLLNEISEGVRNGAEKRVYLAVDARARYGDTKAILVEIRRAGIENVSFLTEKP